MTSYTATQQNPTMCGLSDKDVEKMLQLMENLKVVKSDPDQVTTLTANGAVTFNKIKEGDLKHMLNADGKLTRDLIELSDEGMQSYQPRSEGRNLFYFAQDL